MAENNKPRIFPTPGFENQRLSFEGGKTYGTHPVPYGKIRFSIIVPATRDTRARFYLDTNKYLNNENKIVLDTVNLVDVDGNKLEYTYSYMSMLNYTLVSTDPQYGPHYVVDYELNIKGRRDNRFDGPVFIKIKHPGFTAKILQNTFLIGTTTIEYVYPEVSYDLKIILKVTQNLIVSVPKGNPKAGQYGAYKLDLTKGLYKIPAVGYHELTPNENGKREPADADKIKFAASRPIACSASMYGTGRALTTEVVYDTVSQEYSEGFIRIKNIGAPESAGPQRGNFVIELKVSTIDGDQNKVLLIEYETEIPETTVPMNTEVIPGNNFYVTPYVIDLLFKSGMWDIMAYSFVSSGPVQVHDGYNLRPEAVVYTVDTPSYKEGYIVMRLGTEEFAINPIDYSTVNNDSKPLRKKFIAVDGWTASSGGKMIKLPVTYTYSLDNINFNRTDIDIYRVIPKLKATPGPPAGQGTLRIEPTGTPWMWSADYNRRHETAHTPVNTEGGYVNIPILVSGFLPNTRESYYTIVQGYAKSGIETKPYEPYRGDFSVGRGSSRSPEEPSPLGDTWTGYMGGDWGYKYQCKNEDAGILGCATMSPGEHYYAVTIFGETSRTSFSVRGKYFVQDNPKFVDGPANTGSDLLWKEGAPYTGGYTEKPITDGSATSAILTDPQSLDISSTAPVYVPPPPAPIPPPLPPGMPAPPPGFDSSGAVLPPSPIPVSPPAMPISIPPGFVDNNNVFNRSVYFYNKVLNDTPQGDQEDTGVSLAEILAGVLYDTAVNREVTVLNKISNTLDFINAIHDRLTNDVVKEIDEKVTKIETHQKKIRELGEDPGIHVIGPYENFAMVSLYRYLVEEGGLVDEEFLADPAKQAQALAKLEEIMNKLKAYRRWE